MTSLLTEVHDAFVPAGVPDDEARKAAEAPGGDERRFDTLANTIDLRFASFKNEIDGRLPLAPTLGVLFVSSRR